MPLFSCYLDFTNPATCDTNLQEIKDFWVHNKVSNMLSCTFVAVKFSDSLFFLTLGLAGSLEVGKSLGLRFSVR